MDMRRVNVRAIIWNNGMLFAVKHKKKNGDTSDYWCLPGGGLDPYESLEDGIRREMIEETGVTPQVGRILFGQQLRSGRQGYSEELEFFFHITNHWDYETIDISETSHGLIELAKYGFIDPKNENILPAFLQTIDIEEYISTVKPATIFNNLLEDNK